MELIDIVIGNHDTECMILELESYLYSMMNIKNTRKTQSSKRQFQRDMIRQTWVTPKYLQRILRLQETIAAIKTEWSPNDRARFYYDQSHMIREFRLLTGDTPGELIKKL